MSKKGENIYKRKDGRWEARYLKSDSGKYGYCYGRTYKEAKSKSEEARLMAIQGEESKPEKLFSFYCRQWQAINYRRVKRSTYAKYSTMLDKHIIPYFGSLRPERISTYEVSRFSEELISEKGVSYKTVRDILTLFRSIINYSAGSCNYTKECNSLSKAFEEGNKGTFHRRTEGVLLISSGKR